MSVEEEMYKIDRAARGSCDFDEEFDGSSPLDARGCENSFYYSGTGWARVALKHNCLTPRRSR